MAKSKSKRKSGKRRHPLEAVPIIGDSVEYGEDAKGLIQVRFELAPQGRIATFMARRFSFRRRVRIKFDERGSFFWRLIDSERCLRDIQEAMREEFDLSDKDSKNAVVVFTKTLMLRRLIQLRVPEDYGPGAQTEQQAATGSNV